MTEYLPDEVIHKIKKTGLNKLKSMLRGIESKLEDSQNKTVQLLAKGLIEGKSETYYSFCKGPVPEIVESLRIELAVLFMYHLEIAKKYLGIKTTSENSSRYY